MTEIPLVLPAVADGEDKRSPFKNIIRNNYKHLKKWAKRTRTDSFRIYDREVHHYPLAIDFYAGRFCVHYFSRFKDDEPSDALVKEVTDVLTSLFQADPQAIYWRSRIKRSKYQQYEKAEQQQQEFFTVYEYGLQFKVNLLDYLDTGLFLDHRETRKMVGSLAKGKRVLNLFAYTCAFSVHAAAGGAIFTKSVDMSNTYTAWGKENFILNGLPLQNNVIIREDCAVFLQDEIRHKNKYDIIIIDPPTLSRSKKMEKMFDIQEDYITLLARAYRLLEQDGVIFFSTNSRKFHFDETLLGSFSVAEISDKTIPQDFHDPKIHRCWRIQAPKNGASA